MNNLFRYITLITTLIITMSLLSADDITTGCDLPDAPNTSYLYLTSGGSVLYKSIYDMGGLQFIVDGTTPSSTVSVSGGDASANGLLLQTSYNASFGGCSTGFD